MARPLTPASAGGRTEQGSLANAGVTGTPIESIDEIGARFPDEWVLVRVDQRIDHQPSHGQLLAHDPSQERILEVLVRACQEPSSAQVYLFYGGRPPATVEEWRERLFEAAGKIKDYRDGWW